MAFENLTKKLQQLGQDTKNSVQKMSETYQLNSKIGEEKRSLEALFAEVGKTVFDKIQEAPIPGLEELTDKFDAIKGAKDLIASLEDQAQKLRGVAVCPECGKTASKGEKFCSACGAKLPEIAQPEEAEIKAEDEAETAAEAAVETAEQDAEEATRAAEEAADKVIDDVKEVGNEVGDFVNEAADKARDFLGSFAGKAGAFMQGVSSRIKKEMDAAKEAKEAAKDAEEVEEAAEDLFEEAKEAAADVADQAEEVVEEAAEKVEEAAEAVEEAVEEAEEEKDE